MDPVWQAMLIMAVGLGLFGLYWYSIWAPEVRGEVKIVAGGFEFSDGKKATPCEWGELRRAWLYSEYDLRVKAGLRTLRMDPRCPGMAEFLPMLRGKLGEAFFDFPAAAANLARAAARHRAGEPLEGGLGASSEARGLGELAQLAQAWKPPKAALAQAFQSLQTQPLLWGQAGLFCAGLWGGMAAVFNSGLIFYADAFKGLSCLGCLAFFYYFPPRRRRILSLAAAAVAGFFFWRFYETAAGDFAEETVRVASKSALPDIRREGGLASLIPFRVRLEDAEEDLVTGFDNYFKIKPGDTGRARVFSRGRTVYLESFQKL